MIDVDIPKCEKHASGLGKTFIVYHVQTKIKKTGDVKMVLKRFNDFRSFDDTWFKLYPGVREKCWLPSSIAPGALLFNQNKSVVEERKVALVEYLRRLSEIKALQPLLSQFLEIDESIWGESKKITASVIGPPPKGQRKATTADSKDLKKTNTGLRILSVDNKIGESRKGNNDEASAKAMRDKEEFIKRNQGLLQSLMPGRHFNLSMASSTVSATEGKDLGMMKCGIYFFGPENKLTIDIYECRDLPGGLNFRSATTDPYVKIYLLPDPEKKTKQKTTTKRDNLNPIFNESIVYTITEAELNTKQLELSIWDAAISHKNTGLGRLVFNSSSIPRVARVEGNWYKISPPQKTAEFISVPVEELTHVLPPEDIADASMDLSQLGSSVRKAAGTLVSRVVSTTGDIVNKVSKKQATTIKDYIPPPSESDDILMLKVGDVITVLEMEGDRWYGKHANGEEGYFPSSHVQLNATRKPTLVPTKSEESLSSSQHPKPSSSSSSIPQTPKPQPLTPSSASSPKDTQTRVKVAEDYKPEPERVAEGCLVLKLGDILIVKDQSDPDWWFGAMEKDGTEGYFPKDYVTIIVPTTTPKKQHRPAPAVPSRKNKPTTTNPSPSSSPASKDLSPLIIATNNTKPVPVQSTPPPKSSSTSPPIPPTPLSPSNKNIISPPPLVSPKPAIVTPFPVIKKGGPPPGPPPIQKTITPPPPVNASKSPPPTIPTIPASSSITSPPISPTFKKSPIKLPPVNSSSSGSSSSSSSGGSSSSNHKETNGIAKPWSEVLKLSSKDRELLLSDEEFEQKFAMNKATWKALPMGKRKAKLMSLGMTNIDVSFPSN